MGGWVVSRLYAADCGHLEERYSCRGRGAGKEPCPDQHQHQSQYHRQHALRESRSVRLRLKINFSLSLSSIDFTRAGSRGYAEGVLHGLCVKPFIGIRCRSAHPPQPCCLQCGMRSLRTQWRIQGPSLLVHKEASPRQGFLTTVATETMAPCALHQNWCESACSTAAACGSILPSPKMMRIVAARFCTSSSSLTLPERGPPARVLLARAASPARAAATES